MYVPILKGREGEYGALQTLAGDVKAHLRPVLEVPPIPWDYSEDEPAKTLDDHLSTVVPKIRKSWCTDPAWIDLLWISSEDRMEDGSHPLRAVLEVARSANLNLIPSTSLVRDEAYQEAVREACSIDHRGVALRVQLADFEDPAAGYQEIANVGALLECAPEETDLIFDLGPIGSANSSAVLVAIMSILQNLPDAASWRHMILAGGSFPQNLTGLAADDISVVIREEWHLWRLLRQRAHVLPRLPVFGDYGVAHPEPSEVDPRIMSPSASIRYTTDEHWIVPKGRNLRAHGFEQFHDVCELLIGRPEYSGQDFSWGDDYIWKCAHRLAGPGNLITWRKVGTSHHLVFVTNTLSSDVGI